MFSRGRLALGVTTDSHKTYNYVMSELIVSTSSSSPHSAVLHAFRRGIKANAPLGSCLVCRFHRDGWAAAVAAPKCSRFVLGHRVSRRHFLFDFGDRRRRLRLSASAEMLHRRKQFVGLACLGLCGSSTSAAMD